MFRLFRQSPAPDKIYASSLQTLHLGYALWYPEPHRSGEPQIGDVGYIRDGAFIRLFNLDTSTPEKKVTFWPTLFEDIELLPPNVLQGRECISKFASGPATFESIFALTVSRTAGVDVSVGLSADYTCKAAQGAVLALRSEAHAETLFESHVFKAYIEKIVVVYVWVKTEADWAAAAFSNTSTSFSGSLKASAGSIAGAEMGGSHSSSVSGPEMHRHGQREAGSTRRDQCVLVKRLKVRRRFMLPRKVVAGAGYHQLPDPWAARDGLGGEGVIVLEAEAENMGDANIVNAEGDDEVLDPLDILLAYILETSGVETAVASDDDVESIISGKQIVDFASYLRQMQPSVNIDGTLGSLCMEDVIYHERERAVARRKITRSDMANWPYITTDSAGQPIDGHVFIGPTEAAAHSLKAKHLVFADSQDPSVPSICYATSYDGKLLAASFAGSASDILPDPCIGFSDGSAIIWDIQSGHALVCLEGHPGTVIDITYAPHGALIATASHGHNCIKIWDASTGSCVRSIGVSEDIHKLAFPPNSLYFYAQVGPSVIIYDAQTWSHIATLHAGIRGGNFWWVSPQGERIATALRGQVKIWSVVTGSEILTINHPQELSWPVAFSPDGVEVLVGCDVDKTVAAFDSRTGQLRHAFELSERAFLAVHSQDGDYVVLGNEKGELKCQMYTWQPAPFCGLQHNSRGIS
ncbi:uncharacterized protein PHACADRAFT_191205 [Phanerochaete carnosa HHB-10118-sp]|uniref:Uncharacterized protein n=1 Tax=Phanerochaete carnosa (strain HHB-10118-sp) TaxID=650164 RepID=K5V802_PHACS|nr:uncharacterized protein PHACADRAFT_191205 [Phanerochaete carnosa HHB-10118-sp]EKM58891.1 hypothetical protein PHACADRAFT_191205 [Phanerochaete carnosa HHB-10118-sp]